MKCVLTLCLILGVFALSTATKAVEQEVVNEPEGDRVQQWGQRSHRSFLLQDTHFTWINSGRTRLRRIHRFPFNAIDEQRTPRIGAIRVIHARTHRDTQAIVSWGGVGANFVGIEFYSAPGEDIQSEIEIWSL